MDFHARILMNTFSVLCSGLWIPKGKTSLQNIFVVRLVCWKNSVEQFLYLVASNLSKELLSEKVKKIYNSGSSIMSKA